MDSPKSAFAAIFRRGAAFLIFATLTAAPLNYASTRYGGETIISQGCFMAGLLWVASLLLERRVPRFHPALSIFVLLVAVAASLWGSGILHPTPVDAFTQTHWQKIVGRWPNSVLWHDLHGQAGLFSSLMFVGLVIADLSRNRAWLLATQAVMIGTGLVVAVVAFVQNITGAYAIYWQPSPPMATYFCGPFYHHTSAGAYLNTIWPLSFGLFWLIWAQIKRNHLSAMPKILTYVRAVLVGAITVALIAAHGAHVSRMPQLIALVAGVVLTMTFMGSRFVTALRSRSFWLLTLMWVLVIGAVVFATGRSQIIGSRWQLLFKRDSKDEAEEERSYKKIPPSQWASHLRDDLYISPSPTHYHLLGVRAPAYYAAFKAIAERPFFGHGPANWMGAASQNSDDPFIRTFFQFLQFTHNDFLQTVVEWGIIGAFGLWGYLLGAVVLGLRRILATGGTVSIPFLSTLAALSAVLLQSLWDFPLQMPSILLNVVVLAALLWAQSQPSACR